MDPFEFSWDERDEHVPIEYSGDACQVSEGCEVGLVWKGERITARVLQCTVGEPNVGEVTGFPDYDIDRVGELAIGATIRFWDRHVFSCAA
jgi:hypothetical protein